MYTLANNIAAISGVNPITFDIGNRKVTLIDFFMLIEETVVCSHQDLGEIRIGEVFNQIDDFIDCGFHCFRRALFIRQRITNGINMIMININDLVVAEQSPSFIAGHVLEGGEFYGARAIGKMFCQNLSTVFSPGSTYAINGYKPIRLDFKGVMRQQGGHT